MIYDFIKATLDEMGYESSQDTPFSQTHDFDGLMFVYSTSGQAISDSQMGCSIMDVSQGFIIYGITSDQFIENSIDDGMGKRLIEIYNNLKANAPTTVTDSSGDYYIVDVQNPSISYEGVDNKQLRVTALNFTVLWSYRYGGN